MINENIRKARTLMGLCQDCIAKELDISRSAVAMIEDGKRKMSFEN